MNLNKVIRCSSADLRLKGELKLLSQRVGRAVYTLNRVLIKARDNGSDKDDPISFEDRFTALLTEDFVQAFGKQLDYLFESGFLQTMVDSSYSTAISEETITSAMEPVIRLFSENFGVDWASEYREPIRELVESMYSAGKEAMIASVGFAPFENMFAFDMVDLRAIEQLENIGVIWTSVGAEKQIITPLVTSIVREGIRLGVGREDMGRMLYSGLREAMPSRSEYYFRNLGAIVMNRTRSFARLHEAESLGFTKVEWLGIPDDAQCDRCEALDGQVWEISSLMPIMYSFMDSSSPDDIIGSTPFVNSIDKSTKEFVLANGSRVSYASGTDVLAEAGVGIPPVHGLCRCTLIVYTS